MKLGITEIEDGIYQSAINKIKNQLKKDNFIVNTNYHFLDYNTNFICDLFAYNNKEKRIYEIKLGKNKINKNQFEHLQNFARKINAKLYIIYVEIPQSKNIQFYGIEDILFNDLSRHTPNELVCLATNVYINDVENIDINSIIINKEIVHLDGTGTLYAETHFGSPRDIDEGFGIIEEHEFDFVFKISINQYNNKILKSYYKIDTEYFYH